MGRATSRQPDIPDAESEPPTRVVELSQSDVDAASRVLAQAFSNDPMWESLFLDAVEREARLRLLFRFMLRYGCRHGEIFANPNLEGIAVWLPHYAARPSALRALRNGGLLLPFRLGLRTAARLATINQFISSLRARFAPIPHSYLAVLGVAPEHQRSGFGASLLKPKLARLDRASIPCFLETENRQNLSFYERFGFKPVHEAGIPDSEVRVWFLVRQPAPV